MSLEDIHNEMPVPLNTTVEQLIEMYGAEAVRRGIEYAASLNEADENYRKSAQSEELDKGWARRYGIDPDELETEASDKWAESMEDKGLGLDQ